MSTCTKVTLRKRPKSNRQLSLYFDFYPAVHIPETMRTTRRETLGLTIWADPKNEIERTHNKQTLLQAEAIRSVRVQALVNEQFGFLDQRRKRSDFLAYFKKYARQKDEKWMMVYAHFAKFTCNSCLFGDLTVDLCTRFREYLLGANQLKHTELNISQNTAASYFITFRAMLKIAYRNRMIAENINDFLDAIPIQQTRREYLTLDEIKLLMSTPCKINVLKRASLFAFLTGLRISDILQLRWSMVESSPLGGFQLRFETKKTKTEAVLPINDEALELMGDRTDGAVFDGFKRSMTQKPLKDWLRAAGIGKDITFHCFRHSYATHLLTLQTDIYTVSKMLTHKHVSTTQIYANLVDVKRHEAANKITLK